MKPEEDRRFFFMRMVTLVLFFLGILAGILRYTGLTIFFSIIIVGDILTDVIIVAGELISSAIRNR